MAFIGAPAHAYDTLVRTIILVYAQYPERAVTVVGAEFQHVVRFQSMTPGIGFGNNDRVFLPEVSPYFIRVAVFEPEPFPCGLVQAVGGKFRPSPGGFNVYAPYAADCIHLR